MYSRFVVSRGHELGCDHFDFDLRASHARTLLPAALASVPFGFVLVRVRVRSTSTRGHHIPADRELDSEENHRCRGKIR